MEERTVVTNRIYQLRKEVAAVKRRVLDLNQELNSLNEGIADVDATLNACGIPIRTDPSYGHLPRGLAKSIVASPRNN